MKALVLNGSPRKKGTISNLLRLVIDEVSKQHQVEWIDVYSLQMRPCIGCMKCRPDNKCVLPEDDAHIIGIKIQIDRNLLFYPPQYITG